MRDAAGSARRTAGLDRLETYSAFAERVQETKRKLLDVPDRGQARGQSVAGYGAPGKGNTLLNYCGIRTDFIDYTVDRNPYKHGQVPARARTSRSHRRSGSRETRPDYVLILPWNLRDEIVAQLAYVRELGRAVRRADPRGRPVIDWAEVGGVA